MWKVRNASLCSHQQFFMIGKIIVEVLKLWLLDVQGCFYFLGRIWTESLSAKNTINRAEGRTWMSVTFSQDMFSGLAPVKPYCFPHSFDLRFIFRGFISVSNQTCTFYSGFSPADAGCHVEIIFYYNQHDLCVIMHFLMQYVQYQHIDSF